MSEAKVCNRCGVEKPLSEYYKAGKLASGKSKYMGMCKQCNNAYQEELLRANPDRLQKRKEWKREFHKSKGYSAKRWRKGNPFSTLVCPGCEQEFVQTERKQKYCTSECREQHYLLKAKEQRRATGTLPKGKHIRKRPTQKTCRLCGQTKLAGEFKHGRICAACMPGYQAAAHQKHKAYYRRKCAARQKGLRDIPGSHTDAEWEAVKAQYNHTCLCCGRSEPEIKLTRDHVLPITKGGTDNIDNIQPLCLSCNCSKNDKYIDYR